MSPFIFNHNEETIFFYGGQAQLFELINDSLRDFFAVNPIYDSLLIITNNKVDISDDLIDNLKNPKSFGFLKLQVLKYDEKGTVDPFEHFDKRLRKTLTGSTFLKNIKQAGIGKIFSESNPILLSDGTFHYVHPSGKHSDFFLRASNMLMSDSEILFMAFWMLSFVSEKTPEIVCDTSSIIPLAQAILILKGATGCLNQSIPYKSFGSYSRFRNYDFQENSLILISATNSGDLEKELLNKCATKNVEIVTILNNCESHEDAGISLYNSHSEFKKITNEVSQYPNDSTCELCQKGSIPVTVHGDQFIPSRLTVRTILINKSHLPRWINEKKGAFKTLIRNEAIKVFGGDNPNKKRELYLDLDSIYKQIEGDQDEYLFHRYKDFLDNDLPMQIEKIIYLDDPASKTLAENISLYYNDNRGKPLDFIDDSQQNLRNLSEIKSTLLVVGSCVSSGKRLLKISREVRNKTKDAAIMYFVPILRARNSQEVKILESNLTYRDNHKKANRFKWILEFYIPDHHTGHYVDVIRPSWADEIAFLESKVHGLVKDQAEFVHERYYSIMDSDGLVNNLFLENPFNSMPLELRNNFALYDFLTVKGDNGNQAEVYFIISSLLHQLRHPQLVNGVLDYQNCLIQHEHIRTILSTDCFTRYNDGIIQASFLRASKPVELDYTSDPASCDQMYDILMNMLIDEESEAILEFLYAIAIGKLRLMRNQIISLAKEVEVRYPSIPAIQFYSMMIRQNQ